jgi:hypothetical protein
LIAIVEGRGDEPVEAAPSAEATAEAEPADAVASSDAGIATGSAVPSSDATQAAPSGAVPATEQEPGPLETAGGAAEVLGTGEVVDAERAPGATE